MPNPTPLFQKAPSAPLYLQGRIMAAIGQARRRAMARKTAFFSVLLMVSAGALAWGLSLTSTDMAQSGFGQYLSLIFTDFDAVSASVGSWASSLLETTPALSLAVLLIGLAGVLESIRSLAENLRHSTPLHLFTF